jgi:hypothetical protein
MSLRSPVISPCPRSSNGDTAVLSGGAITGASREVADAEGVSAGRRGACVRAPILSGHKNGGGPPTFQCLLAAKPPQSPARPVTLLSRSLRAVRRRVARSRLNRLAGVDGAHGQESAGLRCLTTSVPASLRVVQRRCWPRAAPAYNGRESDNSDFPEETGRVSTVSCLCHAYRPASWRHTSCSPAGGGDTLRCTWGFAQASRSSRHSSSVVAVSPCAGNWILRPRS